MTTTIKGITRRHALAATGAGVLAAGLGVRPSWAAATVRQGYQTNMWGMPTYYLLHSGILKKHGIDAQEFAVPSGNLTMQQMVARQVDMGTFAGPSFIIGHDRGGLIAVAKIEYVGKTARVMARKELGITKVEQLKGKKITWFYALAEFDRGMTQVPAWRYPARHFQAVSFVRSFDTFHERI